MFIKLKALMIHVGLLTKLLQVQVESQA
jgi:hypothetical protein